MVALGKFKKRFGSTTYFIRGFVHKFSMMERWPYLQKINTATIIKSEVEATTLAATTPFIKSMGAA